MEEFLRNLSKWNVFYLPPGQTEQILLLIKKMRAIPAFSVFDDQLKLASSRISNGLSELISILEGSPEINSGLSSKIHFPLIEENISGNKNETYSYLESVTVKISKGYRKNNFIIIPSLKIVEERLETQIEASWTIAIGIIKKYCKNLNKYHDVIINFDNRLGEYTGDSLGIAIMLAFMQELFVFYNAPIKLTIDSNSAFSGGINKDGDLIPVNNDEFIRSKVECVFFSTVSRLVVHKSDEDAARSALNRFLPIYPSRKIKIIGVEDFEDLKNRRDIVRIKKQNIIIRTAKFIYKYKIAAIIILFSTLGVLYANIDFDTNPAYITSINNFVYIHNNNGKILWSKELSENLSDPLISSNVNLYARVINVDKKGFNEVILSNCVLKKDINSQLNYVTCLDYKGNIIWKYRFEDYAQTAKDIHSDTYVSYLIDTMNVHGNMELFLYARNYPLYPSAIYKLNLKTGKRIRGTFWHPGHLVSAVLNESGSNGKAEIAALAISNNYERCVLFSLDADSLNGQGPAKRDYTFFNVPKAKLNHFILLPKTDLNDYYKLRFNLAVRGDFIFLKEAKSYEFSLIEGLPVIPASSIMYDVKSDFSNIKISVGDTFQVVRDSLIAKGYLDKPYSNTKEYVSILKKQIKYWDGKEFRKMY